MTSDPIGAGCFIRCRVAGERIAVSGSERCRLGHRVERPDGLADGMHADWEWDGRRLTVRNDRYGLYPLYYHASESECAVSPSLATLVELGAPRELDDGALAVFLRTGYFLAEQTPLRAVRALPPNATLVWEGGRTRLTGGFTLTPPWTGSRERAVEAFIEVFRAAVRRHAPPDGDFAVALSGGEDSRHILLALSVAGLRPRFCVTYGAWWGQGGQDLPIARRLAAAVGAPHVVLRHPSALLPVELRKNLAVSFCSYRHPQTLTLADHLAGRVGAVFDGLGGDVLARSDNLTEQNLARMEAREFETRARLHLPLMGERIFELLTPAVRRRFSLELAVHAFAAELGRHAEAPNPIGSFIFWNMLRRELATGTALLFRGAPAVLVPFLDRDVFDLLASLPARMVIDHRFHREAILRAYPEHAAIPFPEAGNAWIHHVHVCRLAADLARYLAAEPSDMLDRGATALRLLRVVFSGRAVPFGRIGPHPQRLARVAHLLQLERFLRSASGRSA